MPSIYHQEEKKVQKACEVWKTGKFNSIADAARSVDANVRRVRDRLAGVKSRSTRPTTNRLLTDEEEEGILRWLDYLDTLGTRPSLKQLEREVNWVLSQRDRAPDEAPIKCGENFATRFLQRFPKFKLKPEKPRDLDREVAEDVEGLKTWYKKWDVMVRKYEVHAENSYNWDESPIRLGQSKTIKKITALPNITAGRNTSRETCTVGEMCVCRWVLLPGCPGYFHRGTIHAAMGKCKTTWFLPD
jgi:hypothetical protein